MVCDGCGVSVTFREVKDSHGCGNSTKPSTLTDDKKCHCCPSCGVECTPPSYFNRSPLTTVTAKAHVHRWVCPKALVPCMHSARGCAAIVPRDELEAHLKACTFEALGPFFAVNDARFAALERRHEEVRAENEYLRAQLWTLRRFEILPRSLRDGLGSMGGPEAAAQPHSPIVQDSPRSPAPATRDMPSNSLSSNATRMDPAPPPQTLHPTTLAQPTSSHASDSFLSPTREQLLHIPQSFLSPPPRLSYADWVLGHLPPPSTYGDGCAALRAALIHLATGLDASERRNEVYVRNDGIVANV